MVFIPVEYVRSVDLFSAYLLNLFAEKLGVVLSTYIGRLFINSLSKYWLQ